MKDTVKNVLAALIVSTLSISPSSVYAEAQTDKVKIDDEYKAEKEQLAKAISEDIGMLGLPGFAMDMSKIESQGKELAEKATKTRSDLRQLILTKPAPSPELDLTYSRYLNAQLAVVDLQMRTIATLREHIKGKTLKLMFDISDKEKRKNQEEPSPFQASTPELQKKYTDILKANEKSLAKLKETEESAEKATLEAYSTESDPKPDKAIEALKAVSKEKIQAEYAQVFQIRNSLGETETKSYFAYLDEKEAEKKAKLEQQKAEAEVKAKAAKEAEEKAKAS